MNPRIDLLLQLLDQAYDKRAWHGTNLRGGLRGLGVDEAGWRPARGRHNIWEIALHTAYWKFSVRRYLTGDRSLKFARRGSDWPALPAEPSVGAWKSDLALLRDEHRLLREVVASFPVGRLTSTPAGLKWRFEQYVYGAASHDLYHAGQIQMLKRLYRTRKA